MTDQHPQHDERQVIDRCRERRAHTDAFRFEVLDTLEPPQDRSWDPTEDLNVLEAMWREKLQPFGY